MTSPTIVWFRDDLRLADNPALHAARVRGGPIIPLYLLEEGAEVRPLGAAARWWLHHSLAELSESCARLQAPLILRRGRAEDVIPRLAREVSAGAVSWNRRYGAARRVDARLATRLRSSAVEASEHPAGLMHEPWEVLASSGEPYRVFTPYWRAAQELPVREVLPAPTAVVTGPPVRSDELADWGLLPTRPDWAAGLRATWTPGERSARERLNAFAESGLDRYHRRDEPAVQTSRLSPHLRFGEISAAQIHHRLRGPLAPQARTNVAKFRSELAWRDFNTAILYRQPDLATRNFRSAFDAFPWSWERGPQVEAWQRGRTGIPLVDAGMRELWQTGTMSGRVRMVVASFLVKNLLRHWRIGEEWFWDTLVDADEANNAGNWQWVAGSGADAAPYFRVFNPQTQAAKFDPAGEYVTRWVPELGTAAYPGPIVDLADSRRTALEAFDTIRR